MAENTRAGDAGAAQAFADLAEVVRSDQPLGQVLSRVAHMARSVVPHAVDVSVTLVDEPSLGRPGRVRASSAAFTSDLAVELDERQYERGFGPCLEAAVSGATVVVDVRRDEDRYGDFVASCRRRGVTHTLSVGLPVPQRTVGGLNVYTDSAATGFTDQDVELVQDFAGFAAVAIANASLLADNREEVEHLQVAMRSRAVIEQAKGIVMAQRRCSADEAFELLRTISRSSNVKLRLVCEDVVAQAAAGAPG